MQYATYNMQHTTDNMLIRKPSCTVTHMYHAHVHTLMHACVRAHTHASAGQIPRLLEGKPQSRATLL